MEDEIDLKQYLDVILKHWKLILVIALFSTVVAFFQSSRQPKLYKATATIMVTDSSGGGLGSALSALSFLGGGGGGGLSGGEGKLAPILKSRALAREVAQIIDLTYVFSGLSADPKLSSEEKIMSVAGSLQGAIDAQLGKSGLFEVSVVWNDPKIAAELANKYIEGLGKFLNTHALNINYQVLDPALPPCGPFNRDTKKSLMIGFLIGLFAGAFLAFFMEYLSKLKKA